VRLALALLLAALTALPAAAGAGGARIAFTSPTVNVFDVVTIAPDGTGFVNLTPGAEPSYASDEHPSWSPDGTRIAFDSHRDSNTSTEIYVMNADGSDPRRLTFDGPTGVQSTASNVFDVSPAWSPRGDLIAYVKIVGQEHDVRVMGTDGGEQRPLTSDGGSKSDPVWSPDGTRLLYARTGADGTRVYTVGLDGSPPVALSPPGSGDFGPVWSPDGTRIAFTAGELYVMNADGSGRQRITDLPAIGPSWRPDGALIAFTGTRSFAVTPSRFGDTATLADVFVVAPDGTGQRRLTGSLGAAYAPWPASGAATWWPDGSRLFFVSQRGGDEPPTTYEMNADGTCEGRFAPTLPVLLSPTWQPGAGPGLGPIGCAELRLTAQASTDAAGLGKAVEYRLRIENDGTEAATSLRLVATFSANARVTSAPDGCTPDGATATCALDSLAAGKTATLVVGAAASRAGFLDARFAVSAAEPDPDPTSNALSLATKVLPCTEVGTTGNDVLYGTPGPDRICGRTGADRIYGRAGNDFIDAGNGDDRIDPGPGRDTVLGKGGRDVIEARDGQRDWIDCGTERDTAIVDRIDVVRHCEVVVRR
jgi:Tol biopolymer transport system component